jgi:hypothetical protein
MHIRTQRWILAYLLYREKHITQSLDYDICGIFNSSKAAFRVSEGGRKAKILLGFKVSIWNPSPVCPLWASAERIRQTGGPASMEGMAAVTLSADGNQSNLLTS